VFEVLLRELAGLNSERLKRGTLNGSGYHSSFFFFKFGLNFDRKYFVSNVLAKCETDLECEKEK
jgi:hypothetical protein